MPTFGSMKKVIFEVDDVFQSFTWLIGQDPETTTIFDFVDNGHGNSTNIFYYFKQWRDTYPAANLYFQCAVFWGQLSSVPTTFKSQFEACSSWLKFTLHSSNYPVTYGDPAIGGPTPSGTSMYDDYFACKQRIIDICGEGSWLGHNIVTHGLNAIKTELVSIATEESFTPVMYAWVKHPNWNARTYDYWIDATVNDAQRTYMAANGYWIDPDTNFVFIPQFYQLEGNVALEAWKGVEWVWTNAYTDPQRDVVILATHEDPMRDNTNNTRGRADLGFAFLVSKGYTGGYLSADEFPDIVPNAPGWTYNNINDSAGGFTINIKTTSGGDLRVAAQNHIW